MLKGKSSLGLLVLMFIVMGQSANLYAQANSKFIEYDLYPVKNDIDVRIAPNSPLRIQYVGLSTEKTVKVIGCDSYSDEMDGEIGKKIKTKWAKIKVNRITGWVKAHNLRDSNVTDKSDRKTSNTFYKNLAESFIVPCTFLERKIIQQYGALFTSKGGIVPSKAMFSSKDEVLEFQAELEKKTLVEKCGEKLIEFTLQKEAMIALENAKSESNLIKINCDEDAASRSFSQAKHNWDTRVKAGLNTFKDEITEIGEGKIKYINLLIDREKYKEQIAEILFIEDTKKGVCFGRNANGPILYSAAAPGVSQHHSMLAVDISKVNPQSGSRWNDNEKRVIRRVLRKHGWFETVYKDWFHFTYLGKKSENTLSITNLKKLKESLGLKTKRTIYWVPQDFQPLECRQ